jgi:hypothetical protein
MYADDGAPLFAFQDLDYIPFGFSSNEAPYIETSVGTMRAAAALMGLGTVAKVEDGVEQKLNTVVCDLGCGDGAFRKSEPLLCHKFQTRSRST